jgi:ribulose-5-phosphate 4-epimerase/fuculose-1-phosphate aldolase
MMGNHGVTVLGETVAEAFERLYYLEKVSKTMVLAHSTGQPLNMLSHELATQTANSWDNYAVAADTRFEQLKSVLEKEEPDYKA